MTTRIGKALSFSNLVACLALFIALGGTVYAAGKISGKQIKVRSLPGNRIKPRTIAASRIKAKSLTGRQVKKHSLTGKEIKQKTLTEISAAALANVNYQVTTVPIASNSSDGTTATVDCPAGMHAIGGGATVSDENDAYVNDSGPSSQQIGWTATGFSRTPGRTLTVTAVCVIVRKPSSTLSSGTGSAPHPFPVYKSF